MKLDNPLKNLHGLKVRFILLPLLLGGTCVALFFLMNIIIGSYLEKYCNSDEFLNRTTESYIESMQKYVAQKKLGTDDVEKIVTWAKKQPMVYMELFENKKCVYSTVYDNASWWSAETVVDDDTSVGFDENVDSDTQDAGDEMFPEEGDENLNFLIQAPQITVTSMEEEEMYGYPQIYLEDWEQSFPLKLKDGTLDVVMYLNVTSKYKNIATVVEVVLCAVLYVFLFSFSNRKMVSYICQLRTEVQILEGGDLNYPISIEGHDELTELAASMDSMRLAFKEQVEQEAAMHEANKNLITEMSHDLRTPLTSLLLYTEILKYKKYQSEDQLQEYLEKIEAKANQMKHMSDHIFAYSLSDKTRKNSERQKKSFEQFFGETLREAMVDLEKEGFLFDCTLKWEEVYVFLSQEYVVRIIDNVFSNIRKYAQQDVPIHIETVYTNQKCGVSFFNTIRENMEAPPESNGIGLKSVKSMVEQMGGSFQVEQTDIGFSLVFLFDKQ